MRFIILLLLLVPTASLAQDFAATLDADLNGDGLPDQAKLTETPEGGAADLTIFLGQPDGSLKQDVIAKSLVWVGGLYQQPELSINPHGSLLLNSMNESIGRDRWHQTLTVAWRDDIFMLAGFTYSWYDTLDLENSGTCDVNLLTGKGKVNVGNEHIETSTFRTKSRSVPIDKWDREPPSECFPDN